MIKRIVKLTFRENESNHFISIFNKNKTYIRNVDGCHHLELLRQRPDSNVFFTLSYWESEAHLDAYRNSEWFQNTWNKTKTLFADRPVVWSLDSIAIVD